jgi:hypothetical protein
MSDHAVETTGAPQHGARVDMTVLTLVHLLVFDDDDDYVFASKLAISPLKGHARICSLLTV